MKWSSVSRRLSVYLVALIRVALGLGIAATLLGFVGSLWWMFDLLAHFRVQYCWALVIASVGAAVFRRWRWLFAGALGLITNLSVMLPLWLASPAPHDQSHEQLDVLMFNVHHQNREVDRVISFLRESNAEVIVLVEATPQMQEALTRALPAYAIIGEARTDAFGMLICTRLPIESQEILYLDQLPAIAVSVRDGNDSFSVLGLHTMPPMGAANSAMRDRALEQAGNWAASLDNAIIVGDFNASPWSSAFRTLEASGLINSQRGFGMQLSWPGQFWPLSIPIDHCLHSPSLTTISRTMGPFLGSDHRSLRVFLGIRK